MRLYQFICCVLLFVVHVKAEDKTRVDKWKNQMMQIRQAIELAQSSKSALPRATLLKLYKQLKQLKSQINQYIDHKSGSSNVIEFIEAPPPGFSADASVDAITDVEQMNNRPSHEYRGNNEFFTAENGFFVSKDEGHQQLEQSQTHGFRNQFDSFDTQERVSFPLNALEEDLESSVDQLENDNKVLKGDYGPPRSILLDDPTPAERKKPKQHDANQWAIQRKELSDKQIYEESAKEWPDPVIATKTRDKINREIVKQYDKTAQNFATSVTSDETSTTTFKTKADQEDLPHFGNIRDIIDGAIMSNVQHSSTKHSIGGAQRYSVHVPPLAPNYNTKPVSHNSFPAKTHVSEDSYSGSLNYLPSTPLVNSEPPTFPSLAPSREHYNSNEHHQTNHHQQQQQVQQLTQPQHHHHIVNEVTVSDSINYPTGDTNQVIPQVTGHHNQHQHHSAQQEPVLYHPPVETSGGDHENIVTETNFAGSEGIAHSSVISYDDEHKNILVSSSADDFGPPRPNHEGNIGNLQSLQHIEDIRLRPLKHGASGYNSVRQLVRHKEKVTLLPAELTKLKQNLVVPGGTGGSYINQLQPGVLIPSPTSVIQRVVRRLRRLLKLGHSHKPLLMASNYYDHSNSLKHPSLSARCRCMDRDLVLGLLVAGVTAAGLASYSSYLASNGALSRRRLERKHSSSHTDSTNGTTELLSAACRLTEQASDVWSHSNDEESLMARRATHLQPDIDYFLMDFKRKIFDFIDQLSEQYALEDSNSNPDGVSAFTAQKNNTATDVNYFLVKLIDTVLVDKTLTKKFDMKRYLPAAIALLKQICGAEITDGFYAAMAPMDLESLLLLAETFATTSPGASSALLQNETQRADRATPFNRMRTALKVVRNFFLNGVPRSLQNIIYDSKCKCIGLKLETAAVVGGPIFVIIIATGLLSLLMIQYGVANTTFGRKRSHDQGGGLSELAENFIDMDAERIYSDQSRTPLFSNLSATNSFISIVKRAATHVTGHLQANNGTLTEDCAMYVLCNVVRDARAFGSIGNDAIFLLGLPVSWLMSAVTPSGSVSRYCQATANAAKPGHECGDIYRQCRQT